MNAISRSIVLFLSAVCFASTAVAAPCSEADAYNKMMALGRVQSRLMSGKDLRVGGELAQEVANVGQVLADKKFDQACAQYDAIAKKYNVDLQKETQGLVTFDELQKDGGKRGGECSQADASIKMMNMHQQLEDMAALGDVDRDIFRKFGDDTSKLSELLLTNPSEMCRKLDALKPKYGLK